MEVGVPIYCQSAAGSSDAPDQFNKRASTDVSDFLFSPAAPIAAPIRGRAERFPIRRIFCVGRNYEAHA